MSVSQVKQNNLSGHLYLVVVCSFDQEIHDSVSSQNDALTLLINYQDLASDSVVVKQWKQLAKVQSHNTQTR